MCVCVCVSVCVCVCANNLRLKQYATHGQFYADYN